MITTCIFAFITLIVFANLLVEFSRDLMMMQQNSYRNDRYMRWLRSSGDTTTTPRILAMAVVLLSLVPFATQWWAMGIMAAFAGGSAITLLRKRYKKPLVWTPRARRIYSAMVLLALVAVALIAVAPLLSPQPYYTSAQRVLFVVSVAIMAVYCASHIITMGAVWLLQPIEKHINQGYYDDAASILASMPQLKVIGITGSYGKTSTKHYLQRILAEQMEVLMTPGSYNTTLGVIRTVREMLKPYHEVFIVEMGAKQIGDIKEICDLVHPSIGIVTAVGPQHLESFKTIENVQRTKFELIDALPQGGLAVVNNDFEFVANRQVTNVECVRYGIKTADGVSYTAADIVYSPLGTDFTLRGSGSDLKLHTRLVGECNISNLIAAIVVARHLGVTDERIRFAVSRIEQVEHRLSVKHTPAGITIIDDAFNSNPTGSAMALDVLAAMQSGRRILVTPGMIELGERQHELNRDFGQKAASCADVAIVVGEYNRQAIAEGLRMGGMPEESVHTVDSFAEAQRLLSTMMRAGDTVLYENDLPDTFK